MSGRRGSSTELPRIASEQGELGDLLRMAQGYVPPLDQREAFARTAGRARRNRDRFWRAPAWVFAGASACAAAIIVLVSIRPVARLERGVVPPATVPVALASAAAPDAPPSAPPGSPPFLLQPGESRLEDGTRVRLTHASAARVESGPKGVRVGLERGTIAVDVARQAEGRSFEIHSGEYRFVAIGTAFTVSASSGDVALDVTEGRVAVLRDEITLARVGAGESWRPSAPAPAPAPPSSPAPQAGEPAPQAVASAPEPTAQTVKPSEMNCLELARTRRAREAESCFVAQAAAGGLGAELALFELSRLRSDVLRDPNGALAALEQYRTRFPNGSLRSEVDVAHIHLLARLGRHAELVAESARLLQAATGRERGAELRMLRANALRGGLRDCRGAVSEYAEVERAGGRFATDALFYRAVCLETLGDTAGAARAYQSYLAVPGRPREAEARRRLGVLAP